MILRRRTGLGVLVALCLVVIVALLAKWRVDRSREDACVLNMRAIGETLASYRRDHAGDSPTAETWAACLLAEGLVSEKTLRCPADPNSKGSSSYRIGEDAESTKDRQTVVLREIRPNHWNSAHVLYSDGLVVQVALDLAE